MMNDGFDDQFYGHFDKIDPFNGNLLINLIRLQPFLINLILSRDIKMFIKLSADNQ